MWVKWEVKLGGRVADDKGGKTKPRPQAWPPARACAGGQTV